MDLTGGRSVNFWSICEKKERDKKREQKMGRMGDDRLRVLRGLKRHAVRFVGCSWGPSLLVCLPRRTVKSHSTCVFISKPYFGVHI